ncbi:unnamed protein product [Protopolystoma xenopodis]|uniref:Uncharacterized protein n=1 Tax=Protopolystoma xenopodis TaxID=117903 RepID=A0A3S5ACZ6_9PLAT|nr:unnamed protein product [Protopolystoma xenopodis]
MAVGAWRQTKDPRVELATEAVALVTGRGHKRKRNQQRRVDAAVVGTIQTTRDSAVRVLEVRLPGHSTKVIGESAGLGFRGSFFLDWPVTCHDCLSSSVGKHAPD